MLSFEKQIKVEYFKVKPERIEYLGERYFRFSYMSDSAVQVCFNSGHVKKGKGNVVGVYIISKITFLTNYLSMGYAEPCSKLEFDKKFDLVVKMLK